MLFSPFCKASLPSLISLILLCYSYQRVVYLPLVDVEEAATESKAEPTLPVWRAFIATGVTWFLYDFNSYGNTFSSKEIVRSMLPIPDSPAGVTIPLILAGLFGVPGQLVVHSLFRHFDVRSVQRIGFGILSFLFMLVTMGLRHHFPSYVIFLLYHLTFFFSTCGPGSTTYILPSLLFDEHQLSLFHGICTCMGKFGGALGASLFPQLVSRFGASPTMLLCCALSFIACILSSLVC
ncbi:hypothetical protein JH06_2990 [Blastocystis sp. subtype 4]|uniref:hypothetical protein n=1 Tax=Blastocystis sp. subtype 4 TaxID=944170 RepID=UPI0007114D71|nr:hypothetical protein JH06_2990 [Blastocystis sp. subtype 4]KNB46061.1 hypothetical protein JH06_2990 [Blastocystis sp. subtype 4]|eukprot:XP_014529520.1 hypothetical protein JH06_2990 [Blastocystis sp. subtype 4]